MFLIINMYRTNTPVIVNPQGGYRADSGDSDRPQN